MFHAAVESEPFDAAVVLGALLRPDGSPSPAMLRRIGHAVRLFEGGRAANLLMSGGPVGHPTPEAEAMRALALAAGIPAERIAVEVGSRNTIQNARLSRPILAERGWNRVLVVTDAFHLPRALYVFRRLGIAATGAGARPERPSASWHAAWAREAAALPWTVARVETARFRLWIAPCRAD
ncbi:MAG: YdcF family protein [Magnetospirillum sp.]|nr:YdcF family protein [Magnetospirillum sp.]